MYYVHYVYTAYQKSVKKCILKHKREHQSSFLDFLVRVRELRKIHGIHHSIQYTVCTMYGIHVYDNFECLHFKVCTVFIIHYSMSFP